MSEEPGPAPPPTYPPPTYAPPAYPPAPYPPPAYPPPAYAPATPGPLPMYGYPTPVYAPMGGWSPRSKVTAGILQLVPAFFGICGVGRLYTGHVAIGLTQLLLGLCGAVTLIFVIGVFILPAVMIWSIVDGIVMLAGSSTDREGRPLHS